MANSTPENEKITTIKIYRETKLRLDKLKEYTRESYDEVLRKILFILNILKKDSDKAQDILERIDSKTKNVQKYTEVYTGEKIQKNQNTEKNEKKNNEKNKS